VTIYSWLILALWLIFIAYWALSAIGAKRNLSRRKWWREVGVRLIIIAIILFALRLPVFNHPARHVHVYLLSTTDARLGIAGVTLCALGVALAIWARVYLGKNWGMPMSRKEHPELVTTGPYAHVRHPIYTGLLLAMFGSAIAETAFWLVPLVVVGAYFIYSARSEEKGMVEEFPERYPAYQKRTKILVPFLL
jgi:protein-S-isoprenylcysteine O-methyltransferase Ste14